MSSEGAQAFSGSVRGLAASVPVVMALRRRGAAGQQQHLQDGPLVPVGLAAATGGVGVVLQSHFHFEVGVVLADGIALSVTATRFGVMAEAALLAGHGSLLENLSLPFRIRSLMICPFSGSSSELRSPVRAMNAPLIVQYQQQVFGHINRGRGFMQLRLRGLTKVNREWRLICADYNLLKRFRFVAGPWLSRSLSPWPDCEPSHSQPDGAVRNPPNFPNPCLHGAGVHPVKGRGHGQLIGDGIPQ